MIGNVATIAPTDGSQSNPKAALKFRPAGAVSMDKGLLAKNNSQPALFRVTHPATQPDAVRSHSPSGPWNRSNTG